MSTNRFLRISRGMFAQNMNEPVEIRSSEPKPMPGASMRKDGYEVLGSRSEYGAPGDIEENYPARTPSAFALPMPMDDD